MEAKEVFELSDGVVEQIVFAMEDQEAKAVLDLETGEVLPAEGHSGDRYATAPTWSSREGFRLMEDFLATVRLPSARRELGLALGRGRGVFKAFKAVLAAYPDLERAFRDFKHRAMRRSISAWYDDLREAKGLERLGPEPEETEDLIVSDLDIRVEGLGACGRILEPLIRAAEEEALDFLPAAIASFEVARLRGELAGSADGFCAYVDDGEGGALGAAAAVRLVARDRGIGRIVFLSVREGFRRMGLGRALLRAIAAKLSAEGATFLILDSALLPGEYGE
ncbi:MAG TPA: GNAT family N-acetyltransferase, partial [Rectinemataceae bacterium]|nr:GNAT family N-acetyltransferase [Rectinemataceae bacterium]